MGRLLTVLVALALVAACSSDGDGEVRAGDDRPSVSPAGEAPRYRGTGMVLESDAGGPDLCFSSLDSYPPQCGDGIPLEGWDWSAATGYESASGTRWGSYEVVGTWDGETLTVERFGPPSDEPGGTSPVAEHDLTTPCETPEGGWAVPADTPKLGQDDENAMHEYARAQPEYSASWVDNSAGRSAAVVTVFRFSADAARHEAAIRDLWGGPVCVIEGGVPLQDLERIRTEVQDEVRFSWSNVDEIGGTVEIGMHVVDPELQADLDRRYGEGVVELHGNLQAVE